MTEEPDVGTAAERRRHDPGRVPALVDGTFAIILTILVLDVRVPSDLSEQSLREALDEIGPTLIAWIISFLLVAMYWVWHRDVFVKIRAVNRDVVWLNILFLLPVSLVPLAASVLGEYHDEAIALRLYGLILIGVSLARMGLYRYVSRRPTLLWEPIPPAERRVSIVLSCVTIALYASAMSVAGVAHQLSLLLYLLVPATYFVVVTLLRDRPRTATAADDFS